MGEENRHPRIVQIAGGGNQFSSTLFVLLEDGTLHLYHEWEWYSVPHPLAPESEEETK